MLRWLQWRTNLTWAVLGCQLCAWCTFYHSKMAECQRCVNDHAKSESAWQVFQRVLPKGMNTRYELLTGHLWGSETGTICWAQSQLAPTLWRVWMCSPSQRLQPLQRRANGQSAWKQKGNRPVSLCWDNSPPAAYIDSQNASHFVDLPAHKKKTKHGHETPCSADAGHGLFIF